MSVFKAYDIRGKYPAELNEETAYKLGRAFVRFLNTSEVCVGRDMRISSPFLFENLIEGVMDEGADVIDIGLCSTPMFYFAMGNYQLKSGIMITASHNPSEYNGFKLCGEGAKPIGLNSGLIEIEKIFQMIEAGGKTKRGNLIRQDISGDYTKFMWGFVKEIHSLKVVVDAANAMAGLEVPLMFKNLNVELIPLYFELDGSFPNHPADPLDKKNLAELQKRVKSEKANLGIAFDGDADRVFFVDEKAKVIPGDLITALIAKSFLKNNPGVKILFDLRSSKAVGEVIKENNGIPVVARSGHTFMKESLRGENAIFGGELSGHYYFSDFFYCDSGMLAAILVMNIICKEGKPLSKLIKPIKRYYSTGEINFKADNKDEIIEIARQHFSDASRQVEDGLYVEYSDWWLSLRKSSTEPLLRLVLEAKTRKLMAEKAKLVKNLIKKSSA